MHSTVTSTERRRRRTNPSVACRQPSARQTATRLRDSHFVVGIDPKSPQRELRHLADFVAPATSQRNQERNGTRLRDGHTDVGVFGEVRQRPCGRLVASSGRAPTQ